MNITTPQAAGFNGSMAVRGPYVFVSMPMFCGADDRLAAEAGLVCDEAQHQTWVDVEPITGTCVRACVHACVHACVCVCAYRVQALLLAACCNVHACTHAHKGTWVHPLPL
jgi:hypothetical protein